MYSAEPGLIEMWLHPQHQVYQPTRVLPINNHLYHQCHEPYQHNDITSLYFIFLLL